MVFALLFLAATLGIAVFSRARVSRVFEAGRAVAMDGKLTGAEAARRVLEHEGVKDVVVVERGGLFSNCYDPARRRLVLAPEIFHGSHAEAVGIALHETGHALQQHAGHDALVRRIGTVRAGQLIGGIIFFAPIIAAFLRVLPWRGALWIIVGGWAVLSLLNLFTVGIETSASNRVKRAMEDARLLRRLAETEAVESVLAAAAWMRVGEILDSPKNLLWSLSPFRGWKKP